MDLVSVLVKSGVDTLLPHYSEKVSKKGIENKVGAQEHTRIVLEIFQREKNGEKDNELLDVHYEYALKFQEIASS